ncbi:MAG: hypothetical protein A2Y38_01765 [Spirochaetes bacterium GWB1_59_5]|nr:MAG: hypothetical protein A2Y38_01765 [Spirochaetes bacterium GWB1_59_5]
MDINSKKNILTFPYGGSRPSYYVYHPALHGPSSRDGLWEEAAKRFHQLLDSFCGVCELYNDEQTHSETVGGSQWKKEVLSLFRAIEVEEKDVYQLEALAHILFNTEDRLTQRVLPYHYELKEPSAYLRREDSGLMSPPGFKGVNPIHIQKSGWAG